MKAKGIKLICNFHNIFESTYVFGAFSPLNGDILVMELPYCDGDNFQIFFIELSNKKPTECKVVILDNCRFHNGKSLIILQNIALIFIPLYSPELNPAELVWLNMKRKMTNIVYKTIEELKLKINEIVKKLITEDFI